MNTSISKTTGKTPFESLYGYIPRFNDGLVRELTEGTETYRIPEEIQYEIIDGIEYKQNRIKERYDRNLIKNERFNIGDIVTNYLPLSYLIGNMLRIKRTA